MYKNFESYTKLLLNRGLFSIAPFSSFSLFVDVLRYLYTTPSGDYDDSYCITFAQQEGGVIVSNDRYRDAVYKVNIRSNKYVFPLRNGNAKSVRILMRMMSKHARHVGNPDQRYITFWKKLKTTFLYVIIF